MTIRRATMVLVRADAGPAIGAGHVMRCLAIAEALVERGVGVTFLMTEPPGGAAMIAGLAARVTAAGAVARIERFAAGGVDDLTTTLLAIGETRADAVIVDGYGFDEGWRAELRWRGGVTVAVLDDTASLGALHADLVVNPAPVAADLNYVVKAPGAALLLGPRYALLRREFREAVTAAATPVEDRDRVLVTFGGSDPAGLTGPCAARLVEVLPERVALDVVVGGGNPRLDAIRALTAMLGPRVALHVDTLRMADLMAGVGMAVSAAGGTTGELAVMGVPTVLAIVVDNQAPAAGSVGGGFVIADARGPVAESVQGVAALAAALWEDGDRRREMSAALRGVVDGLGAVRVAEAVMEAIDGASSATAGARRPSSPAPSTRA